MPFTEDLAAFYAQMRADYPWATVSFYDVRRQMNELEAKLAAASGQSSL